MNSPPLPAESRKEGAIRFKRDHKRTKRAVQVADCHRCGEMQSILRNPASPKIGLMGNTDLPKGKYCTDGCKTGKESVMTVWCEFVPTAEVMAEIVRVSHEMRETPFHL